jgi:hypothetical protein
VKVVIDCSQRTHVDMWLIVYYSFNCVVRLKYHY